MYTKPHPNIRSSTEPGADPYGISEHLPDNTVCKICGSVFVSGRWYSKEAHFSKKIESQEKHETICPACHKMADKVPGGVLTMSGSFVWEHRDEILNLIRNESNNALRDNPLERVMTMEDVDDEIQITTTNEKLAQRIGKALHKAYDGDIEYKWSEDNKLARVDWHRE